jgi:uncharacterized caspase-like protein
MNTTDVLTSKVLINFIEQLRFAGYNIGAAQYIAAQDLLLALAAQGKMPSELTELRLFLAPILCHSPKEQAAFDNHFDRWINQLSKAHSEIIPKPSPEPERNSHTISNGINFLWKLAAVIFFMALISKNYIDFEDITIPPLDKTVQIEINQPEPVETEEKMKSRFFAYLSGWGLWLTLLLSFLLAWYIWRRYWAQPFLTRKITVKHPDIKKWFVEGIDDKLFQSVSLSRTAQQLRKHINIPSTRLDIMATLEKTLRAGGWLKPVMGTMKSRPEYLVLIDRTTFNDHQAKFINSLINQIVAEDVLITRYYFDADPRRCYPEKKELPPRTLTELAQHYPTHLLMIFSDGNGFINPITGERVKWIEQLSIWLQRVLFTLEIPAQWGYREQILDEADFLILPANEAGLTALAEQINIGTWQPYPAPSDSYAPAFPDYFNERPRRWLERHAPDAPMLTELLKQVRDFLGEEGYYWFSACAVYPEIRWQLTLYLGYQLKLLTEERFAKLARLPWFRYGNMPNWLRERLVDDLSLEQEKAIRTELNVLWAKVSDEPISDFQLEIAHDQKTRLSKLGEQLLSKWIHKKSLLRDYVFLSFIPYKLAVKISNRLFTYPKMSMKAVGAVIAVSLLVGILSFFFLERNPQYDQQYTQHALVVGINQYKYAGQQVLNNNDVLNNIQGAVNDALLLRDALRRIPVQLKDKWVLLDANATRANFLRAWQDIVKQAKPGDTLIITFSGHGGQIPDAEPFDEKDSKDEFLMFHDFKPQKMVGRITDDEINGLFLQTSAYKILFVADISHSSGMMDAAQNLEYVTLVAATESDNLSIPETTINDKQHGALSWYFAQALAGKADYNQNGFLERNELQDFLVEKVREQMNSLQIPKVFPRADMQSVIRISSTPSVLEPKPTPITDKDNDTIPDNEDNCPNNTSEEISKGVRQRGSKKGCPVDGDNDGVPDYKDSCQETLFGIKVDENGCATVAKELSDYHIVKRGETLHGIAVFYGKNYEEVARWNNISPPYILSVGQKLRVSPPELDSDGIPVDSDNDKVPDYRDDCPQNTPQEISKGVDWYGCPFSRLAASGTLIAFATSPDKQAFDVFPDSEGDNSPFTKHLLKVLRQKSELPIELVLKKVRVAVKQETDGQQTPWYSASLEGEFFFSSEKNDQIRRVALVIGNAEYQRHKLKNPVNNANDMADVLKDLGFKVILITDANQQAIKNAIGEFGERLREGGGSEGTVGLFYYSGHGVGYGGINYIIPIKALATITEPNDLKNNAVNVNNVLATMNKASTTINIIIIDAAYNSPFGMAK